MQFLNHNCKYSTTRQVLKFLFYVTNNAPLHPPKPTPMRVQLPRMVRKIVSLNPRPPFFPRDEQVPLPHKFCQAAQALRLGPSNSFKAKLPDSFLAAQGPGPDAVQPKYGQGPAVWEF